MAKLEAPDGSDFPDWEDRIISKQESEDQQSWIDWQNREQFGTLR